MLAGCATRNRATAASSEPPETAVVTTASASAGASANERAPVASTTALSAAIPIATTSVPAAPARPSGAKPPSSLAKATERTLASKRRIVADLRGNDGASYRLDAVLDPAGAKLTGTIALSDGKYPRPFEQSLTSAASDANIELIARPLRQLFDLGTSADAPAQLGDGGDVFAVERFRYVAQRDGAIVRVEAPGITFSLVAA